MTATDELGVFAKHWTPGAVKTRLAASIGKQAAADLYRQFLAVTLARFADLAVRRVVAYSPADETTRDAFRQLCGTTWRIQAQSAGDLGQRMRTYFRQAWDQGRRRVVLLGSDSPLLPVEYVRDAFAQLDEYPLVLGPSDDGGYYLIGASGPIPPIFDGIPWSGPRVWQATTSRLKQLGRPFACLPSWYDVDDRQDLERLARQLFESGSDDPIMRRLRQAVEHSLSGDKQGR